MESSAARIHASGPVEISFDGPLAFVRINRPEKRNAIDDESIGALEKFFGSVPEDVRCVILSGNGGNFSAGLDLSEHIKRRGEEVLYHSRGWHKVAESIQFGSVPVVALLNGAVMGGGLELAAACHVRIAEGECLFRLPEGQRGIFVGGGGSVRLGRILGPDRLAEMMLTGRTYDAPSALNLGLVHYAVAAGEGQKLARELALKIAGNSRMVNYLVMQAIPRIAEMPHGSGLLAESLAAALSTTTDDALEGLEAFLDKRPPKFR